MLNKNRYDISKKNLLLLGLFLFYWLHAMATLEVAGGMDAAKCGVEVFEVGAGGEAVVEGAEDRDGLVFLLEAEDGVRFLLSQLGEVFEKN